MPAAGRVTPVGGCSAGAAPVRAGEPALSELPDDQVEDEFERLTAGGIEGLAVTAGYERVDQDRDKDDDDEVTTTDRAQRSWSPDLLIELAQAATARGGITPTEMKAALDDEGIEVSNKTLFKWLDRFSKDKRLNNTNGRYTVVD